MAYRIKLNEPAERAYRRIVTGQIERSVDQLRSAQDRVTAVHETRKAMKRLRALARLMRQAMGDATYRAENARYRDIARMLSGARDIDVLRATSAGLARGQCEAGQMAAVAVAAHAAGAAKSGDHAPHIDDAIEALDGARSAIAEIKFEGRGYDAIRPGLQKSYRAGRRQVEAAYQSGEDEAFHDLRKHVQAHWRHMALLDAVWPEMMEARAKLAKDVAELLGEDHDLYVFITAARAAAAASADVAPFDVLIAAAKDRQRDIRRELHPRAQALYAESPPAFAERIALYWAAARAAKKAERIVENSELPRQDEPSAPPGRRPARKPAKPKAKVASTAAPASSSKPRRR